MNVLIIGATSAIGKASARLYASRSAAFFLVARDTKRLHEMELDLKIRGATSVESDSRDLLQCDQHEDIIDSAIMQLGTVDVVLICHGVLPDLEQAEVDFETARQVLEVNGLSVISLLIILAEKLKKQGSGRIAVLTSVAGDRGRRTNYTYGASKALVSTYLQGLRGNLLADGIQIIDIRPGLVDTPMTAGFEKGLFWSSPERVARGIVKAIDRNRHTAYVPEYWRLIMLVVRYIPDFIFNRLRF
ncbi:MAG: SDR family oxidoreductase [Gammaproteobacteria bacterium]|nr:SDR family oxidoreductase [Gammaproteobacteria bacterium]